MANIRRTPDIAEHPDMVEMGERFGRILERGRAVAVDGLVLLAGLYLAVSPWIVGFNHVSTRLTITNLILGLTVAVIGLGLAQAPRVMYRLSWAMVGIGIWALIAPWITHSAGDAKAVINNVITGAITIVLGLCAVAVLMTAARRARASA